MSETRKSLNNLISQKMESCNARLDECGGDLHRKGQVLGDYQIWFEAASEVAQAANLSEEDAKAITAGKMANDAEMLLIERKVALQEALNRE